MTSINVSLPESLRQYVERQVAQGDWATPAEYIRELVRQDRERRLASLEEILMEGVCAARHEISPDEIRARGLFPVLREKAIRD